MSDHNLSARAWATAALVAVPIAPTTGLGWWLPVHLALLGAASQAIVGGQLMFSATLGQARGPTRTTTLTQLALLNLAAILIIGGRLWDAPGALAVGAAIFVAVIGWAMWQVRTLWRRSINRRYTTTSTFYLLAGTSLLAGASIGAALGLGMFGDASSYLEHRSLHIALNVLGWAGLTVVGTAMTLLPTVLHVRAPQLASVRWAPWLMFGGLALFAAGATTAWGWAATAGMLCYAAGLSIFGAYMRRMLGVSRRRRVPTAALHLMAALVWLAITTVALIAGSASQDHAAVRDFVVVAGAAGFVFQALLGAWSFLLPSARRAVPEQRRRELVAMEVGGRTQVAAYNLGLVTALLGLRAGIGPLGAGIIVTWSAGAWAMAKLWGFPLLASLPLVHRLSERWWADPNDG
ncbi:MAG: hypothetical protein WD645_05155 [Dehalococcoidia bacterium]